MRVDAFLDGGYLLAMSDRLKVKIAEGRRVRDPESNRLLEDTMLYEFPATQFWLKRIQVGDVVVVSDEAAKPAPRAKKEKLGE